MSDGPEILRCSFIIFGESPSIVYRLKMAWRALRMWMLGRWPRDEGPPPSTTA